MNIQLTVNVNQTVRDIVTDEYYKAKSAFDNAKQSLDCAVLDRGYKERQLASARIAETDWAARCQRAADRLKDITEFLRQAGVFS